MDKAILSINLIVGLTLLFASCFTEAFSKSAKSLSDIKFKGRDVGINRKIENYGYYKGLFKNSINVSFIFYDDGTLVLNSKIPGDTTCYSCGWWPMGAYYDEDIDRWDDGADGVYELRNDTIYANLYFENCFYLSQHIYFYFELYLYKLKFAVVDRNTIVWCERHNVDYPETTYVNDTLRFIPATTELPPPNTRLKLKKRWLWEKKEDWKNYKKEFKAKKKVNRNQK